MADVTVVCATHGRAGRVTAFEAFGDDLLLSVAESQVGAYRDAYPYAQIDPHPDDVVGLPAKKNWLHDRFGDVFIVDDDATQMIDMQDSTRVPPAKARALIGQVADMAEQMGAYLFGFGDDGNPLHYQPAQPYRLTGVFAGGKFGLLAGSGLWWPNDPKYGLIEDVWMSALNAHVHRKCVRDVRHVLPTIAAWKGVPQPGGLGNVRTRAANREVGEFLKASFGDAIELNDFAVYNWNLRVPWA
jgi:hypothetical protein